MGNKILQLVTILLVCLLTAFSVIGLRSEDAQLYNGNAVAGDFSILWHSKSVLYYDEFYVVAPNAVSEEMLLTYGIRDTVCRSLGVTISSLGVYVLRTAVNGSWQHIYVDGGMISIRLTNLSTGEVIVDQFAVPGLYAIHVSVFPSVVWVRDPVTGAMIRAQRLMLSVKGYGVEDVSKSYSISGILPTIHSFITDSIVYNAVRAINHYITIYIEYPYKPYNVFIAFAPSAEQTVTAVVVTTVTETRTVTPPPIVSTVITTSVLEKTVTREVAHTFTVVSTVPSPTTVTTTLTTTATIEKMVRTTVEKNVTITTTLLQAVERGYDLRTLIGVAIASAVVSIVITLLLVFAKRSAK